jgi:prepilin-type N-terminal cleavage/methylation domain-containing protein
MRFFNHRLRPRAARGFSLIELLTTIAILGVLSSIALFSMSGVNQNVKDTRDRRNAQELAFVCGNAHAAGFDFVTDTSVEGTVKKIVQGGTPTDGAFAGKSFGLSGLSEQDQAAASKFLEIKDGTLSYNSKYGSGP